MPILLQVLTKKANRSKCLVAIVRYARSLKDVWPDVNNK